MRAFVTGGTGFIGGALVRALVAAGHEVRTLVLPRDRARHLDGLPVERVEGDLRDAGLRLGLAECDCVFHVAALYSYWGHRWQDFFQVNVEGTRRVLQAAGDAGVPRIVYTSSVAVLNSHDGLPGDEDSSSTLPEMVGDYKRSKFLAEEVARACASDGLPVVIVNPTTPVGVGDHNPTPTGRIILDFLSGRMPAYVDTGLNIVDVEDVAVGHLLAAERGRVGERYILGAENLTLREILDTLAEVSGRPRVRVRMPRGVALAWSYADVALARLLPNHEPVATPDTVRLSGKHMFFTPHKAVRELGLPQSPTREALRKAVEWYRAHGYAP